MARANIRTADRTTEPSIATAMTSGTARPPPELTVAVDFEGDGDVSLSAGTVRPDTVVEAKIDEVDDELAEVLQVPLPLLSPTETLLLMLLPQLFDSATEVACDRLTDVVIDMGGRPVAYVRPDVPVIVVVDVAPTVVVEEPVVDVDGLP